jgi:hypothetical protein
MESYTLVTNSSRKDLIQLVRNIARLKGTGLVVVDQTDPATIQRLVQMGFQFTGPTLIVMDKLDDRPYQVSGEDNIVKYIRDVQYKVVL